MIVVWIMIDWIDERFGLNIDGLNIDVREIWIWIRLDLDLD